MVFAYVSKDYVYKTQEELSIFDESEQQDLLDVAAANGKPLLHNCSVYVLSLHCTAALLLLTPTVAAIDEEGGGLEKVNSSHGLMQQGDDKESSDMVFNVVNQGYTPPAAAATATPAPIPTTTGDEHTPLFLYVHHSNTIYM